MINVYPLLPKRELQTNSILITVMIDSIFINNSHFIHYWPTKLEIPFPWFDWEILIQFIWYVKRKGMKNSIPDVSLELWQVIIVTLVPVKWKLPNYLDSGNGFFTFIVFIPSTSCRNTRTYIRMRRKYIQAVIYSQHFSSLWHVLLKKCASICVCVCVNLNTYRSSY